jgi:hypothetical protein
VSFFLLTLCTQNHNNYQINNQLWLGTFPENVQYTIKIKHNAGQLPLIVTQIHSLIEIKEEELILFILRLIFN